MSSLEKMNSNERSAALTLASIMSLRMLGLFMVLPLFSLYAHQLNGATPFLIGVSMGIYGLMQATFQIPFGAWSDRIGRKKMITLGLIIFAVGSIIAALTHTIYGMMIGRALQGAGAVGSTIIAFMADLTRENQRTKAMAIIGMTIGLSFSLAMLMGPMLNPWLNVNGLFWLAAFFGIVAILILQSLPVPTQTVLRKEVEHLNHTFSAIFLHPELARLNFSIFILHAIFTASFVVIPISLKSFLGLNANQQWILYLPILLFAFVCSVPCIILAEKKQQLKLFFLMAILMLGIAECLFWIYTKNFWLVAISLFLFFTGFSILEAFLPSLVSKLAPPHRKGTALGIYSSAQFLGIFVGGLLGGLIYGAFGQIYVYFVLTILIIIWSAIAFQMKNPQHRAH